MISVFPSWSGAEHPKEEQHQIYKTNYLKYRQYDKICMFHQLLQLSRYTANSTTHRKHEMIFPTKSETPELIQRTQ